MRSSVIEEKRVQVKREFRASDFSGREIPEFHWSTVTNIWCLTSDHGVKHGNLTSVFDLDLMPEEMAEFRNELNELVARMKAKHSRRVASNG